MDEDSALETIAVDMRSVLDDAAAVAPHAEPTSGADYLPSAQEMLEAAKRQAWKLLTGDAKTPAHVMAKAVDLAVRLAAAEVEQGPAEVADTASVFEMIDSLPPARALELLARKEATLEAELEALRARRERVEIEATHAGEVA